MLPQAPGSDREPRPGPSSVRRKVAVWGAVIVVAVLAPATLGIVVPAPPGLLALEFLAFAWGFTAIGYLLGLGFCVGAARKGMNGLVWGLLFAGPWWPFVLVLYAFSSDDRTLVHPPA